MDKSLERGQCMPGPVYVCVCVCVWLCHDRTELTDFVSDRN